MVELVSPEESPVGKAILDVLQPFVHKFETVQIGEHDGFHLVRLLNEEYDLSVSADRHDRCIYAHTAQPSRGELEEHWIAITYHVNRPVLYEWHMAKELPESSELTKHLKQARRSINPDNPESVRAQVTRMLPVIAMLLKHYHPEDWSDLDPSKFEQPKQAMPGCSSALVVTIFLCLVALGMSP